MHVYNKLFHTSYPNWTKAFQYIVYKQWIHDTYDTCNSYNYSRTLKLDQYNPKPFHDQYEQICKIPEL